MVKPLFITPRVLTETIFTQYGGNADGATAAQLAAAFVISEQWMDEELGTFIVPAFVTATFAINPTSSAFMMPQGKVISVNGVWFIDRTEQCDCSIGSVEGCALIVNEEIGLIDVQRLIGICPSCSCCQVPFKVQIAYQAGLPTGTAAHPAILQGLTIGAQIALEQVIDPGSAEGGSGDPGVQSWSSMRYAERRTSLGHTAFGESPRANFIHRLVKHWVVRRVGKVGNI